MTHNENKIPESLIKGFYQLREELEKKEQYIIEKDGDENLVQEDISDLKKSEKTLTEIIESSENGETIEGRTRKLALAEEALESISQYKEEIQINSCNIDYNDIVNMLNAYDGIEAMVEYSHNGEKVIFGAHDVTQWDKYKPQSGDIVTFYANDTVENSDKRLENAIDENIRRVLGESIKHDSDRNNYIEFSLEVKDRNGLHARPSGSLVKAASKYSGDIYIIAPDGTEGNAKSIMNIMMLSMNDPITYGTRLKFQIEPKEGENITELHKNLKLAIGTEEDQCVAYNVLK